MKMFTNLPGALRILFGTLRALTVVLAAFWLLALFFHSWMQRQFADEPRLMVSVGEVQLPVSPTAVGLHSDSAKPGSLGLASLRGALQVDLWSQDASLTSALRWAVLPAMAVFLAFAWVLLSALRKVCANIERGNVFNEENLRLVRNIGVTVIAYSLAVALVGLWGAHVMGGYFNQHVTLTGLGATAGAFGFLTPGGLVTFPGGLVTGGLVLVVSEAFRQGLVLKTENDLTV